MASKNEDQDGENMSKTSSRIGTWLCGIAAGLGANASECSTSVPGSATSNVSGKWEELVSDSSALRLLEANRVPFKENAKCNARIQDSSSETNYIYSQFLWTILGLWITKSSNSTKPAYTIMKETRRIRYPPMWPPFLKYQRV